MLIGLAFATIQCSALSRGDEIDIQGSVAASTNNLVSPQPLDLFLDQIKFSGHLGSDALFNSHRLFEIHLMNEDESLLLACVGHNQRASLAKMGEAYITYGEIKAQFIADQNTNLESNTPVVVRFIEKHQGESCPSGYLGNSQEGHSDLVLDQIETTYGQLTNQKLIFEGVATVGFVKGDQASWPIEKTPLVANGALSVDQLKIQDVNFGEASSPELALMLYEKNNPLAIGCTDLWDVDSDAVIYGTLRYDFTDADDTDIRLNDLDADQQYVLKLVELDNGNCIDLLDESTQNGVGVTVLESTDDVEFDQLVDSEIELGNDTDYIRLITR